MPATSHPVLYQWEDTIEDACLVLLAGADISNTYKQRSDDVTSTPRVGVQFVPGAATGHLFRGQAADTEHWDQFDATLNIELVTDRQRDAATPQHTEILGKIRWAVADCDNWGAALDYHEVLKVMPQGTTQTVDEEQGQDASTLTYSITFGIRPDAWPTS